jgi:CDP-6-deoxy-D-xylo-4-hexulose-3-dehydrase
LDSLRKAIVKEDIKALMMVHTLGNSTEIEGLLDIVNNNNIILIEDTCESLGTKYQDDFLGSIGDFGTFSFYFSHHMTTIEGGMIVCKNLDDYDLLKCLRTHGWSREQSNKEELERDNSNIDPRWLFINMGFNLRPMEIQAAFGIEQIKRLDVMNIHRKENVDRIQQTFIKNSRWEDQLAFPKPTKDLDPCWFGFPFLIRKKLIMEKLREALLFNGIENRPIISGNIAIQPAIKLFNVDLSMGPFVGAQEIHDRGLFVGCHSKLLDDDAIAHLVRIILDEIQKLS